MEEFLFFSDTVPIFLEGNIRAPAEASSNHDLAKTESGQNFAKTESGRDFAKTESGRDFAKTKIYVQIALPHPLFVLP